MAITIRRRSYPTKKKEELLEQTCDGCRWLYNYFISMSPMSLEDMQFALTELKESHPWLRDYYHSKMLRMVIHQIDAARSSLNTLESHGRKVGRLRYCKEYNTLVYNQSGFRIERHDNTDLIWLSKIGFIEIRLSSRKIPINIKQVSVTKKPSGKWFVNIVCEEEARPKIVPPPKIDTSKCIGIDMGITKFCHDDSNNHSVENPLFHNKSLKRIRRINRGLSRKKFGSNNYQKHKHMRARLYERIYNNRHDFFLHKESTTAYSRQYDLIFLEKLQISNMVKNHHLSRHILDSGWGYFKNMLKYKVKIVIEVNPAFTTVVCSWRCGNKVPKKSLAVRIHRCDKCGAILDRDHNGALNVLQRGRAMLCLPQLQLQLLPELKLPMGHGEVTPAEILLRGSVKQEESSGLVQR